MPTSLPRDGQTGAPDSTGEAATGIPGSKSSLKLKEAIAPSEMTPSPGISIRPRGD